MSENQPIITRGRSIGQKDLYALFQLTPCEKCGKERWVRLTKGKPTHKLCRPCKCIAHGERFRGEQNPTWKGGQYIRRGWRYCYRPNHPYARANGYVLEHRLVMEEHLGRYLSPQEVVHHKDKNRPNNALNNLIVFTSQSEHAAFHDNLRQYNSNRKQEVQIG